MSCGLLSACLSPLFDYDIESYRTRPPMMRWSITRSGNTGIGKCSPGRYVRYVCQTASMIQEIPPITNMTTIVALSQLIGLPPSSNARMTRIVAAKSSTKPSQSTRRMDCNFHEPLSVLLVSFFCRGKRSSMSKNTLTPGGTLQQQLEALFLGCGSSSTAYLM